ncbi:MAG: hypothetical protein Q9218_002472 [Villophora microphyllina]
MAAQSRLALRTSGLDELPATVIQRNPSPLDSRKRTRQFPNDNEFSHPAKKACKEAADTSTRPNIKTYSKRPGTRPNAAPAVEEAVTQPTLNSPTPPAQPTQAVQPTLHLPSTTNSTENRKQVKSTVKPQNPQDVNKVDKRSLRSHDGGSRFKSDLALYFADYDEILTDEPKTQEFLNPQTLVHIVDEPSECPTSSSMSSFGVTNGGGFNGHDCSDYRRPNCLINGGTGVGHSDLNGAERLDFSSAERHTRQVIDDPLTDQVYFKAHRRAERGEKQHRNREKESAQHEQFQLERILEALKGPAWLKTMGITGITDSERKTYEPKRLIFIQRVTTLLNKFRAWKEEEKRRRFERERASTGEEEEEEGEEDEDEEDSDRSDSVVGLDGVNERTGRISKGHARSRAKHSRQPGLRSAHTRLSRISNGSQSRQLNTLPPPVDKPFTSFFSKPYLREAALSRNRRGRLRFAFGQKIPELELQEFSLPPGLLTAKLIRANARSKRAAKREGRDQ